MRRLLCGWEEDPGCDIENPPKNSCRSKSEKIRRLTRGGWGAAGRKGLRGNSSQASDRQTGPASPPNSETSYPPHVMRGQPKRRTAAGTYYGPRESPMSREGRAVEQTDSCPRSVVRDLVSSESQGDGGTVHMHLDLLWPFYIPARGRQGRHR